MTRHLLLLLPLLGIVAALALAFTVPESATPREVPHPQVPGMRAGGAGEAPIALAWAGWLFGVSALGLFTGLLAFGLRPRRPLGRLGWVFAAGYLLQAALFTALHVAAETGWPAGPSVLGLPPASALMLLGLWPAPAVFVVLYVAGFERWVMGPRERARLEELMRRRGQERGAP